MFDEIDAAYFRQRASEERERAVETLGNAASRHRKRAMMFEAKAREFVSDRELEKTAD